MLRRVKLILKWLIILPFLPLILPLIILRKLTGVEIRNNEVAEEDEEERRKYGAIAMSKADDFGLFPPWF